MKIFLAEIFFLLLCGSACAQVFVSDEDSLYTRNFLTTDLTSNSNSAAFISRVNYTLDLKKFELKLKNRYISNISKLERNFFRDGNDLDLTVNYKLSQKLYTGGGITARNLSDDKNVELNENNNNFFYSNFEYYPTNNIYVDARAGYKNENQIGEINTGVRGSLYAELNNINFQDFLSYSKVDASYENLTQKVNYNYELNSQVYKNFSQFSDNESYVKAYTRRNDFYFPASQDVKNAYGINNNIESRAENLIYVEDKLRYIVSEPFLITLGGSLSLKNIARDLKYKSFSSTIIFDNNYNSEIKENSLTLSSDFEYTKGKIYSRATLFFSERAEIHKPADIGDYSSAQVRELERIENNKNNNSRRTSFNVETLYNFSNTNSFRFAGSSSIFRYDTDSKENFDDRDELYLIGSVSHRYTNLGSFELTTTFDVTSSKLSYLFKERSSNNYRNNIYKLTSNSFYRPFKNLLINSTFQVLANYTVYDFEDIVSQVQSFSYRQLYIGDTVYYNAAKNLSLDMFGEMKISEQGQFNDSSFSVRPLTYQDNRNLYGRVNYLFFDFVKLSAGYKMYEQRRFDYKDGVKSLKSTITNYGPVAGLSVYLTRNSYINFTGGIDYFKYDDGSPGSSSSFLTLNVLWNI